MGDEPAYGRGWDVPIEKLQACDVIFRGGITSGVIYPGTVATLSERYRFVNIGRASAGAIAAGITAAAEYGWITGRGSHSSASPFRRLGAIATEVNGGEGSQTSLRKLFRAADELHALARFFWSVLWIQGLFRTWRGFGRGGFLYPAFLTALLLAFFVTALAGLLVGASAILTAAEIAGAEPFGEHWMLWLWVSGLFGLVVAIVLTLVRVAVVVRNKLPAAHFGLCPGVNPRAPQTREGLRSHGALMDWMHVTIQDLASRSVGQVSSNGSGKDLTRDDVAETDRPLTIADLWGSPDPLAIRKIDVVLTTTNLSQQLPHQFPFLLKARTPLFFRREDLERVIPADVVNWMVIAASSLDAETSAAIHVPEGFHLLPAPADLPVLFGIRLSLSFPGLISVVKLYAPDSARTVEIRGSADPSARPLRKQILRACWFSDGGITSNFPISAFDAPLPSWPTFCINLRQANPVEEAEQAQDIDATPDKASEELPGTDEGRSSDPLVAMAMTNSAELEARFGAELSDNGIAGFVSAIVSTARNGQENEQMLMPGYRDRIVHAMTRSDEGGLNLGMKAETIRTLSDRGAIAARLLTSRFHPDGAAAKAGFRMGWANQRWIRYRSTMAALEQFLAHFRLVWEQAPVFGARYNQILVGSKPNAPENKVSERGFRITPSYKWSSARVAEAATESTRELSNLSQIWQQTANVIGPSATVFDGILTAEGRAEHAAPRPKVVLQLRPGPSGDPRRFHTLPFYETLLSDSNQNPTQGPTKEV